MSTSPFYNVMDYGATGDGLTDDTVSIQRAVNAAQVIGGAGQLVRAGPVILPPGKYIVSEPIIIPLYTGGTYGTPFLFSGYGADIASRHNGSVFKRVLPTSTAQAGNAATVAPIFEGFKFSGLGLTGSKAIDMAATYGLVVRDCVIDRFDIGIALAFCLKARLENVFAQICTTYSIAITSAVGLWDDATITNSSSNSSDIVSCHVSTKASQVAGYYLRDSDNLRLIECIAEGPNPVNNVDYAAQGVRYTFWVENMHFENNPTGAHIRVVSDGRAVLRAPVFYSTNSVLVDGSGSHERAVIVVDGLPYIDIGNKFKHGATDLYAWDFRGIGSYEHSDITLSSLWVDGVVPTKIRTLLHGVAIGVNDQTIRKRQRGTNSIADGGTIAHGLGAMPVIARAQTSISGEFASVTALDSTNIIVSIKKHDGTSGTVQTIYWDAEI